MIAINQLIRAFRRKPSQVLTAVLEDGHHIIHLWQPKKYPHLHAISTVDPYLTYTVHDSPSGHPPPQRKKKHYP